MSDMLEDVKTFKNQARRRREAERYEEASALLMKAIELLEATLKDLKASETSLFEIDVARELSDCQGSRGGVLRSAGRFAESVAAYDRGYVLDADERYGFVSSYNLVQRLVARMLLKPELIGSSDWTVKDVKDAEDLEMWSAFKHAASVIEGHRSVRAGDPWAHADRALVNLMLGLPEEEEAWQSFSKPSPSLAYAITSTLRVINDLLARMEEVQGASPVGPRFAEIQGRLIKARGRLEDLQRLPQA